MVVYLLYQITIKHTTMKATVKTNSGKSNEEVFSFEIPTFEGSEKQIEFASNIFVEVMAGLCNMVTGKMDNEKVKAQYDMIIAKLSAQTSANFWIENKGENFQTIYKSI
jgi:hypothetical protein